jgi:uncharacterized protein YdhG (YjbR/CyaY superfamily)
MEYWLDGWQSRAISRYAWVVLSVIVFILALPSCDRGTTMKPDFDKALQEHFAAISKLHSLVLKRFPDANLSMKYGMPTYSRGEGWVAIANQKNYVSLYTCSAAHLVEFKRAFPQYKTGTGCINFREKQEIPELAITQVIEHAILHPKGT